MSRIVLRALTAFGLAGLATALYFTLHLLGMVPRREAESPHGHRDRSPSKGSRSPPTSSGSRLPSTTLERRSLAIFEPVS